LSVNTSKVCSAHDYNPHSLVLTNIFVKCTSTQSSKKIGAKADLSTPAAWSH